MREGWPPSSETATASADDLLELQATPPAFADSFSRALLDCLADAAPGSAAGADAAQQDSPKVAHTPRRRAFRTLFSSAAVPKYNN